MKQLETSFLLDLFPNLTTGSLDNPLMYLVTVTNGDQCADKIGKNGKMVWLSGGKGVAICKCRKVSWWENGVAIW